MHDFRLIEYPNRSIVAAFEKYPHRLTAMKQIVIKFLFAIIEVVAVVQIAMAVMWPILWRKECRALEESIARGGADAALQFNQNVSDASFLATKYGVEFASIILVVALIGSILCRKRTTAPGPKEQKPRATQ